MGEPQHITVGVTGGIAAYKAVELVRALQTAGLDPHVVMTRAAAHFVQPLTFAAITGHRVITGLWSDNDSSDADLASAIDHIGVAQTTRALVVAPATADLLARFAHGLADDFLTTLYLATEAPVLVAPAMNVVMWNHSATQANLAVLRGRGVRIVDPGSGYLACGMTGDGRLADSGSIVAAVLAAIHQAPLDLAGETILITAGGTREPLDPVRFLGNRSSGKMGHALAEAAASRGARVLLVTAASLPLPPRCEATPVATSDQMQRAVLDLLPEATIVIKAAAVADFRPAAVSSDKLRRAAALTLTLQPTPDIAAEVAHRRRPGTLLLVFAAEADPATALARAREKLARKGADALFLNDISDPAIGFDADCNGGTWMTPATELAFATQSKIDLAHRLLDQLVILRRLQPLPS